MTGPDIDHVLIEVGLKRIENEETRGRKDGELERAGISINKYVREDVRGNLIGSGSFPSSSVTL